jgi:hypothetical protein
MSGSEQAIVAGFMRPALVQNTYSWRNISISLKMPEKGEAKAQTCAIAWLRQPMFPVI